MDARWVLRRRGVLRRVGFLITSLLIEEHDETVGITFGGFWLRRAKRLLPAFFAVILFVAAWAVLAGSAQQRSTLRREYPVVDLLRQQLGPDPRRRPVLRRRSAHAAPPVESGGRGAVVPDVAVGVRRDQRCESASTIVIALGVSSRWPRSSDVLAAFGIADGAGWTAVGVFDGAEPNELPLPLDDHSRRPDCSWVPPLRSVASVALAESRPTAASPCVSTSPRSVRSRCWCSRSRSPTSRRGTSTSGCCRSCRSLSMVLARGRRHPDRSACRRVLS